MRRFFKPKWIASTCIAGIVYALLFTSADYDTPKVAPARNANLRVITYNAQHLPFEVLNKYPNSKYRAKRQAELLAEYDIIGLNEIFVESRRDEMLQILKEAWGSEFHAIVSNEEDRSLFGLDSGLVLLTRFPVLESHTLTFGNDSKLRERGFIADGYAKKGVIHARIKYASSNQATVNIDCFVTHLESQDSIKRDEQIAMLAEFMKKYTTASNPILLLGDLNIMGDGPELINSQSQYWLLRREIALVRKEWYDLAQFIEPSNWGTSDADSAMGGHRIDYIFLSYSAGGSSLIPLGASVRRFSDPHVGFLSDHCAVEAELIIGE